MVVCAFRDACIGLWRPYSGKIILRNFVRLGVHKVRKCHTAYLEDVCALVFVVDFAANTRVSWAQVASCIADHLSPVRG